jgi:hypothetical protein
MSPAWGEESALFSPRPAASFGAEPNEASPIRGCYFAILCGYRGYVLAKLLRNSRKILGFTSFDTRKSRNRTRSDVRPTPANQITVKCPRCDRAFRLNYSDDEWHRVNRLLTAAERALREDHRAAMAELVRHRQTKGSATDRLNLNHRATPRLRTKLIQGSQGPVSPLIESWAS